MKQTDENTVSAENQLRDENPVSFEGNPGSHPRIMFVGNSITRHNVLESIGWYNDSGMAASTKEKDYVHLIMKRIKEKNPGAAACICQASEWERGYAEPDWSNDRFAQAREFNADIIIFRLIENVGQDNFSHVLFTSAVREFLSYLNPDGRARIIITTGFWRHPGDEDLRRIAEEDGYPLADLGVIGDDGSMRAVGLFEHAGVANHPGDKGMAAIAQAVGKLIPL